MLARVTTFTLDGIDARRVDVEADVRAGLPAFTIVGLADKAVREARERVRTAIVNSGFEFPSKRITVNLAPAHLRKVGPSFDLPLAVAVLVAGRQLDPATVEGSAIVGELSLGGEVRPVRGVLAMAEAARAHGLPRILVPLGRAREAALVAGVEPAGIRTLQEGVAVLRGVAEPPAPPPPAASPASGDVIDLARIDAPLFLLAGQRDHITPPAQVFALAEHTSTPLDEVTVRTAAGGHLGLFMGSEALREHWPPILAGVYEQSKGGADRARAERAARRQTPKAEPAIPAP